MKVQYLIESRLSRLGKEEDAMKKYGSTSTQRIGFQTEYDLDAPTRARQGSQASTLRSVRARESLQQRQVGGSMRFGNTSTRITTTTSPRDSSSSRNIMSSTRRMTVESPKS